MEKKMVAKKRGIYGDVMIQARTSHVNYYKNTQLFYKQGSIYVLYKDAGTYLSDGRIGDGRHPEIFYIRESDKINGLQEAQDGLNKELTESFKSKEPKKVKKILSTLITETLLEPRSCILKKVSETMDVVITHFSNQDNIISNLLEVAYKDYTTTIHSINVMAMSLGYAKYIGMDLIDTRSLGLGALLHDVGKIKIPDDILKADRRLTSEEFRTMQNHSKEGYEILRKVNFEIKNFAKAVALEHHEKLDGSGYPNHIKNISYHGKIIGIIDSYEALTNDDRPYRKSMQPLHALKLIKSDVLEGKLDEKIFKEFVQSLL